MFLCSAMKGYILFSTLCAMSLVTAEDLQSSEHRLHEHLLKNYNRFQRPVKNSSETVRVKFGVSLVKLMEMDQHKQQMTSFMWMRQLWRDPYLAWDPSEFGGLKTLRLPSHELWMPDVKLYNGVGKQEVDESLAIVYETGDVLHLPPATLVSMCDMDLSMFPFDTQTCRLKFGSWAFDGNTVDFDFYEGSEKIDLWNHKGSPEWEVVGSGAVYTQQFYPCCPGQPFPDLTFNLTLRRRPTFYRYVFVTPAVMLALLSPVLFLLPSDDSAKFPFGGTLLISVALFYNLIAEQLPMGHNTVPVIGIYYTVVFVLISLSLAISAVTNNIANRATRISQPPNFLKTILLSCLGRLLCVPYDSQYGVGTSNVALDGADTEQQDSNLTKGQREWRLMAMVLDRIFFLFFFIFVIITSLTLLT